MKILTFLMTLLIARIALADGIGCDDIAGSWQSGTPPNSIAYTCTQSSLSAFNCDLTYYSFQVRCTVTYAGSFNEITGLFPYTETYVSGTCPHQWSGNIYVVSAVGGQSCAAIDDTGINYNGVPRVGIEVPGNPGGNVATSAHGENSSSFVSWLDFINNDGLPSLAGKFTATLNDSHDSNFQFSGRTTFESISAVSDDCLGTMVATGSSSWFPDWDHNYSVGWGGTSPGEADEDLVGNTIEYIIQIQQDYKGTLPCQIVTRQQMYIDDVNGAGGKVLYEDHHNIREVGDGYYEVARNGTWSTVVYIGQPRPVWHWWDWALIFATTQFW